MHQLDIERSIAVLVERTLQRIVDPFDAIAEGAAT